MTQPPPPRPFGPQVLRLALLQHNITLQDTCLFPLCSQKVIK